MRILFLLLALVHTNQGDFGGKFVATNEVHFMAPRVAAML